MVSEEDKARMLRSVDIYVAPNTGGESFGMILTEAMAAGAPVVASDLDAFRRVLDGGRAGALFPTGDAGGAGGGCSADAARRPRPPGRAGRARAARWSAAYDWPVVAARVLEVYATAIEATDGRVIGEDFRRRADRPGRVSDPSLDGGGTARRVGALRCAACGRWWPW